MSAGKAAGSVGAKDGSPCPHSSERPGEGLTPAGFAALGLNLFPSRDRRVLVQSQYQHTVSQASKSLNISCSSMDNSWL